MSSSLQMYINVIDYVRSYINGNTLHIKKLLESFNPSLPTKTTLLNNPK